MAVPVAAIVKAAVAVLSNEKTRKAVGWVVAAILSQVILIVMVICVLMSGTADHNAAAVDLTFHGGSISVQAPPEYRQYITDMRGSFGELASAVSEITPMLESGSIDTTRIKSMFHAMFSGSVTLHPYRAIRLGALPIVLSARKNALAPSPMRMATKPILKPICSCGLRVVWWRKSTIPRMFSAIPTLVSTPATMHT